MSPHKRVKLGPLRKGNKKTTLNKVASPVLGQAEVNTCSSALQSCAVALGVGVVTVSRQALIVGWPTEIRPPTRRVSETPATERLKNAGSLTLGLVQCLIRASSFVHTLDWILDDGRKLL